MKYCILAAALVMFAGHALAASREVHYGAPPQWVIASPAPTPAASHDGAAIRVINLDQQIRLGAESDEYYTSYHLKILSPEGLPAGNISAAWNPSTDEIIVHKIDIIRDGSRIDVLQQVKFQVIQRENNLEYAVLDGQLTAILQIPGLQVGDEIEFSATIRRRDLTFAGLSHNAVQLPLVGAPGAYRVRISWPATKIVHWRATPDLGDVPVQQSGSERVLDYELSDPSSAITADGAPDRENIRRLVEYSAFSSWSDISGSLWPLFQNAAILAPNSAVAHEADAIAASTKDPTERAEKALKLVQDNIRYVYVGLDGGDYKPASADETWSRRFGDCKAKTVLLLALLHRLGVESEAVLVNSKGGDGTDQHLPSPALFDHVVVRATIGANNYWLDGTRLGDRRLDSLPPPASRWALPIRQSKAQLEAIPVTPPVIPQLSVVLDLDATAGLTVPAKVRAEEAIHGDGVLQMRTTLLGLSPDDASRAVTAFWRREEDWVQADKVGWRFDEARNTIVFTLIGQAKLDWQGDDDKGHSFSIPGAGFTPPNEFHRPKEQDQGADWVVEFPVYKRWTTIVRLPPSTKKWVWDYSAEPVEEYLGGFSYWREIEWKGDVIRTTMSTRSLAPEITAAQAAEVNVRLPKFDNNISQVFQISAHDAQPEIIGINVAPDLGNYHVPSGEKPVPGIEAALLASDKSTKDIRRAIDLFNKRKLTESLVALNEAMKLKPENDDLFLVRGTVLEGLGRWAEALSDFDEAWRRDPLEPSTIAARARLVKRLAEGSPVSGAFDPWANDEKAVSIPTLGASQAPSAAKP